MPTSAVVLAVAGPLAVAGAWMLIRAGRGSLWWVNGILMPLAGGLSLWTGLVEASGWQPGTGRAVFAGVTAGAGLYAATAAFMAVAGRWPPLARHTAALYENRGNVSLPAAVAISCLLVAPGEEVLWRGVVLEVTRDWAGSAAAGPILSWAGYVAANAFSASLPIALGAIVGGAAWTLLAVLTEGVAASIACHMVWTGLMVSFPPVPRPR